MKDNGECVLFFVKYPVAGEVKSRLARAIGDEDACGVYKSCVLDMLEMLDASGCEVIVMVAPEETHQAYGEWLGRKRRYMTQRGSDIGERMWNGFVDAFAEGYSKVVAIGSDLCDLPGGYITEALAALDDNDVVVGPATDGGYWLIGFTVSGLTDEVFSDIPWSTDEVYARTIEKLKSKGLRVGAVSEWSDLDTVENLAAVIERNAQGGRSLRTVRYILYKKLLRHVDIRGRGADYGGL